MACQPRTAERPADREPGAAPGPSACPLPGILAHQGHLRRQGSAHRAIRGIGSEADSEGADAVEPKKSQSYLAHVAARAIILIEADDPVIGLVAFVPVGMSEVSSCIIGPDIQPGHHVAKGDELGYFQFGGSTHCLVFRPGAIADFSLAAVPQPHDPNAPLVRVRSRLATAKTTA
jgi:phosphatidylserine decarboxylase